MVRLLDAGAAPSEVAQVGRDALGAPVYTTAGLYVAEISQAGCTLEVGPVSRDGVTATIRDRGGQTITGWGRSADAAIDAAYQRWRV